MSDRNAFKIFILEDEPALGIVLEDMLSDLGHEAVQTVGNLPAAQRALEHRNFDCALIDVNLGGEQSFAFARKLIDQSVPFAFVTGYSASAVVGFKGVPILQKPYTQEQVATTIAQLMQVRPRQ